MSRGDWIAMNANRRPPVRITNLVLASVMRCLLESPDGVTVKELRDECGVNIATAGRWLRDMRTKGVVYVKRWSEDCNGRKNTPAYALGLDKKDAPKKPVSSSESNKRWRELQKARETYDPLHYLGAPHASLQARPQSEPVRE